MIKLNALVVGSGSIGERHAENLASVFSADVEVLSRNKAKPFRRSSLELNSCVMKVDLESINSKSYDLCVIATPSSIRSSVLSQLQGVSISSFYFEVPSVVSHKEWQTVQDLCNTFGAHIHFGYNLRYHPGYKHLKSLPESSIQSIRSIFGEYLPNLHTWEDYKLRYEAVRSLGGGPLLTSHHELDAAINLLGSVQKLSCIESNTDLNIDAPDHALITLFHENGISTIDLNFFYPKYTRFTQIVSNREIIDFEPFGSGLITTDNEFRYDNYDFNETYIESISHAINKKYSAFCLKPESFDHLMKVTDACCVSSINNAKIVKV